MRDCIYTILLFSNMLYFSIASIIGFNVEDEGARVYFKYYCILCFVVFLIMHLSYCSKKTITSKHTISYLILSVYIISGFISGYTNDSVFLSLVAYGVPAVGIGVYYAENKSLGNVVKWMDLVLLIVSVSLLFSVRSLLAQISQGEKYYSQELSYYAALCFVICLFFLLFGNRYERFPFFRSKFYRVVSIFMLFYLLAMMFISGGRGALGTLFIGAFIIIYYYHKFNRINTLLLLKFIFGGLVVAFFIINLLPGDTMEVFTKNFDRVFSFFNTDLDIYDRTSGRDNAFKVAFSEILEHPILGSGLFGYKDSFTPKSGLGWPHNIFIEVLMQGGITFFIAFLVVVFRFLKKTNTLLRTPSNIVFLVFVAYPMSFLLFSGSYMGELLFWFSMSYVYNYSIKKRVLLAIHH